jgi:hypothetical protein
MPVCRLLSVPLVAVLLAVGFCGCRSSNDPARYTPQPAVGERALRAALTAWQRGESTPLVLEDATKVEVSDAYRRPGQMLKDFKILGQVAGNGGRWFEVQLQFDGPPQVEQVRYVVIGINPLWVFQQADYEMLAHWDHPVPAAELLPEVSKDDKVR